MPKRLFEQAPVTLNGFDISCDVEGGELMVGRREAVLVTGLCTTYEENLIPNLRRWGVRLNVFINYDASSSGSSTVAGSYVALKSVFDSTASSGVTLTIRASTGARSATNPEWTGLVGIDGDYAVWAGSVAEAMKTSVNLKGTGALSWLTSSS